MNPAPPVNQAPIVTAGGNQTIRVPAAAAAWLTTIAAGVTVTSQ
ncbi:MAG: hypothetical protein U0Q55_15040 [Vicinamibacterales bacterium]